ncbi:MAG TPA: hypothetical protein VFR37_10580 [Longimicrobium sp.]|nr:hypothetical protein [Longimicrobium sp.]
MPTKPTVWNRLAAMMQGEMPATTLEAYRRASLPVFDLMDRVESRRLECATEGLNPWTVPPATRAAFLCSWNAFVLQTLGNDILDADYASEPATTGFVPPVTAHQVLAFYSQVEGWLNRGRQAIANPDYRLDVHVPAELPAWKEMEPYPTSHIRGVLLAMRSVADHAAAAMTFLPDQAPGEPGQQAQLNRIRQLYASAESKARYATALQGITPGRALARRLAPYAQDAIELFYELGQLIADPTLATEQETAGRIDAAGAVEAGVLPGRPGFDIWCLTDPDARLVLENESEARGSLRRMWRKDPAPARTLAIQADIQAALDRGTVEYARSGRGRMGHFNRCPWGPVYAVKRGVTLGGITLRRGQHFVYDVGLPGKAKRFRRDILVGAFEPTQDVELGPHRQRKP